MGPALGGCQKTRVSKGALYQVVVFNTYSFLTVLGVHRCVRAFSSGEQGLLQLCCAGFSCCGAWALQCGLSRCGAWAQLPCSAHSL